MADTSLNDNRISILIRQISNLWHLKLRKLLKGYQISINEYLILETKNLMNLDKLTKHCEKLIEKKKKFL